MSTLKVTNIKAADGTSALSIADSTGKVTTTDSELSVKTTSHTFTVKGIDEVIYEDDGTTVVDADSGQFAVYNGLTKLFGITEHGYVLKPNQPSFMAVANTATQSGAINFTGTLYNVGNHFNVTTDKFTAPVTGTYFFSWATVMSANTAGATISIRKNGSILQNTSVYTGENLTSIAQIYPSSTVCVIHHLTAGDYTDVYAGTSIQATYGGFVGFLIG